MDDQTGATPATPVGTASATEAATDWPELDPGLPPPPPGATRVPRPVMGVAALLAIGGVGGLITAFRTPFLPEALANVAPVLAGTMGLGALAAAVGVWRLSEWGRLLGLGVAIGWLIRDGLLTHAALSLGIDPLVGRAPNPLFDWVLPIALDVLILGVLGLRWPAASAPDAD